MKPSILSTRRQLELMRELQRAATERHEEETRITSVRQAAHRDAEELRKVSRHEAVETADAERDKIDTDFNGRSSMVEAAYESERTRVQDEYRIRRTKAESDAAREAESAGVEKKERSWQVLTEHDTAKKKTAEKLESAHVELAHFQADIAAIGAEAMGIAWGRGVTGARFDPASASAEHPEDSPSDDKAFVESTERLRGSVEAARDSAQALYDSALPRALEGPIPAGAFFGVLSVALPLSGMTLGWEDWRTYAIGIGSAIVAALAAYLGILPWARRITKESFGATVDALREAEKSLAESSALATARAEREAAEQINLRDSELEALNQRVDERVRKAREHRDKELEEITEYYPTALADMRSRHEEEMASIDREHTDLVSAVTGRLDAQLVEIEQRHKASIAAADEAAEEDWQSMFERWFTGYDDVRAELRDMRSECQRLFPDFAETDYDNWRAPNDPPAAIAMGVSEIDLTRTKHGISTDERLTPPETRLEIPVLMALEEHPTLLLTAEGEGRAKGVELLRAMMLRFLTAMPPGKVRFTILDPVGLGESFQSMMHLADIDDLLIAGRIWSEPKDIDEQLARLTNHMETVLQKYLRSEYETIHEYNAQAGEVAEPYQVLVAAGFPSNFGETAARRLVSLVQGGPRCGVYTLLGVDTTVRMPTDFRLDELKQSAAWLEWIEEVPGQDGRFVWRYPAFEKLPLQLTQEPPSDRYIDTVRKAGVAAKEAVKVEVPFSVVTPDGELWQDTCAEELHVPIGRSGAKSLQNVRLGKGTSQHLLVAGKTGSGKSTFLHALVTSAALRFSPDEVEFYLVDFKKGVEFKSYATHRLPHAKVIAIESEREFGLSVLERLDNVLKERGEKFRDAGVQNLADYRAARPEDKTPRVLLIVDEFQELFVEDDKLGQEAALLLDRLVRQGRAFGVHALLGTQTLAGAYSIARSTLGQMAVRVALECSEADSHLILSDERNTAARFLSRPGEAIYNAQNGLVTANEPFQVVWLPDRERAAVLDSVDEHRHALDLPRPEAIVFEGNAPADPATNSPLNRLLVGEAEPLPAGKAPPAWLGAAVAIKPPTSVELGQHPGSNVIVVGSQEPEALGMLSTAAVSLAAADPQAKLVVIDGARPGETSDGVWERVLGSVACESELVGPTGLPDAIGALAAEVASREENPGTAAPIYCVLHNAGRFRDLRKREDDFGFGGFGEEKKPARPDQQLTEVLRNGPSVGVHVLVWCDSYNSVSRLFDRQTMREFAFRVALQMSAADSSNLIDTPTASDLKMHRALLYNDETGQTEKFRPYGQPSDEWLARVAGASRAPA